MESAFHNRGYSSIVAIFFLIVSALIFSGLFYNSKKQTSEIKENTEITTKELTGTEGSGFSPEQKLSKEKIDDKIIPLVDEEMDRSSQPEKLVIKKSILIFVDKITYQQLSSEISRLARDIENDLKLDVDIQYDNYNSSVQIRSIMQKYYKKEKLSGSILIGNIPTFYQKNSSYYTDWFYKELSDRCRIDDDGKFGYDALNCKPIDAITQADVFVGRITAPVDGLSGIALIKKYLDKNHNYRIGKISFDQKMLLYPNGSIYQEVSPEKLNANLDTAILRLPAYTRNQIDLIVTKDPEEARDEYLQKFSKNSYEINLVNIHGSSTSQQIFGNIIISWEDVKNIEPNSFLVRLVSCSNGAFLTENYFAGWLLFSGNTLVVEAATVNIGSASLLPDLPVEPSDFIGLNPITFGSTVGEMTRAKNSESIHLFGDPTLRMRKIHSNGPRMVASEQLDFGGVEGGKSKNLFYTIQNNGDTSLELRYVGGRGFTINGNASFGSKNPIKVVPEINFMGFVIEELVPYANIIISPGGKKSLKFSFAPAIFSKTGLTRTGKYFDLIGFYTNDPHKPYLEIRLTGIGNTKLY